MSIFRKTIKYSKPSTEINNKIESLNRGIEKIKSTLPENNFSDEKIEEILNENFVDVENWREIFDEETVSNCDRQIDEIRERHNDLVNVQGSIEHVKNKEVKEIFNELYQDEVEKVVETYISKYSNQIVDLREDLFHEVKRKPNVNIKVLEDKINFLTLKYNELSEGLLNEPNTEVESSITFEQLRNHYQLLVGRLQEQLATVGGGGEVRLQYLDDIVGIATNAAAFDGKFLRYNHSLKKFEFVTVTASGGEEEVGIALTDFSVTTNPVGTAGLLYDSSNGNFSYTPPNLSSFLTSSSLVGYATEGYVDNAVAGIGTTSGSGSSFSGDYNDLTNKPTIPSVGSGSLTLKSYGQESTAAGSFNANSSSNVQITLPQIRYSDLSGVPTIPTNNNELTNGAGYITTSFTDTNQLTNGAGFITTSFTDTNQLTNGAGYITTSFTDTNQLTNGAGFITTSFTDTNQLTNGAGFITNNVTGDLNVSGNVSVAGTLTYEDVTNIDSVGLITARSGIRVTGNVIEAPSGENKIPSLYANLAALPSASTYHGMFAHVHSEGKGYFAHAGNWLELVNRDTSGNVSINGTINASELNVGSGVTLSSSDGLLINNNIKLYGNNRVIDFIADTINENYETGIRWYESNSTDPRIAIDYNGDSAVGSSGQLEIKGYNNDTNNYDILTVINRYGDVGIGINNPIAKLDVRGSANITGNLTASGISTFNGDVILPNQQDLILGDGFDDSGNFKLYNGANEPFEIFGSAKETYIRNTGSNANGINISANGSVTLGGGGTGSFSVHADSDETAKLYGPGPSLKLQTTNSGVIITGVCTATSFSGDGSGLTGITASGTGVVVQEEGVNVGTAGTINFIGTGVTATFSNGTANIEIGNVTNANTIPTYTSEWTLDANGTNHYQISGPGLIGAENDPDIYLVRGQQYKFTNNMNAHPFRIQSTSNGSAGTEYNDGIANNNVSNGTLTWNVQFDTPTILYYQCTAHSNMGGKIIILDESTDRVYADVSSFPSVSTKKGDFAYADDTGTMYYSNGTSWTSQRIVTTNSTSSSDFSTLLGTSQLTYNINVRDYTSNNSSAYNASRKIIRLEDSDGTTDQIVLVAGDGLSITDSGDEIEFINNVANSTYTMDAGISTGTANSKITLTDNAGVTDEIVFAGADGLTVEYTDANTLTFRAPSGGGGGSFTGEDAQDATAQLFANGTHSGITFTYDDTNNSISAVATAGGGGSGTTYDLSGRNTTSNNAFIDLVPNSGTTDSIEFVGNNGTSVSWDSANKRITIDSTAPVQPDWNATSGIGSILNKPTIPPAYTLPTASSSTLGGIKVGANLSIDASTGTLSANPGGYTLPAASSSTLGGIKIGSGLSIDSNGVVNATGGGGSSVPQIQDLSGTTSSIADNVSAELDITGYKAYSLFKITTNAEAWVRVYVDDASRDADTTRSEGEDPLPGSGVIAEVRTSGAESVLISPGIMGFNNDNPRTNTIYLSVTNRSDSTTTITVTLTALQIGE